LEPENWAPDNTGASGTGHWICVLIQSPAHAALGPFLTYRSPKVLPPGTLVRVPLGKRETLGVVWQSDALEATGEIDPGRVRDVAGTLEGIAPLSAHWQQLVSFAARYYQRSVGEVALAALPPQLRELSPAQMQRRLKRPASLVTAENTTSVPPLELSAEQSMVVTQIESQTGPFLLFGATGSGKTEVYLHCVQKLLSDDPGAQALIMVPEINLTPQLESRFKERFEPMYGEQSVVSLHSGMTNPQRLKAWLGAHSGVARIVLGTRMAVFASMPKLRLLVVDEEHDPSYKSSEGARYSARDLAVYRGQMEGAKVILGSATPSLESWHQSRPAADGGRYVRLHMPSRIGQTAALPLVRRVDMNHQPRRAVFSLPLLDAIKERVSRGEQCLVFLNRRGYAPVLHCTECGWKSECPHCSAFRVFHKIDRTLRCHHCGFTERVPRACPGCGNPDIAPLGRGTEQLEEHLAELLSDVTRAGSVTTGCPEGLPLRIERIDADSTRLKGSLEAQLAAVHSGEVDVLVGTQMIAKGHDFRRITLVAAVNPDGALFSSDFRAPERLFSLLMQAAGRSGRDAALGAQSEVWIQTFQPAHPLYAALKMHDYPTFAEQQLLEREQAAMPPFSAQALVRAEARTQEAAQALLNIARTDALDAQSGMAQWGEDWTQVLEQITLYSAVPMTIQRIANVERAQMLVESPSRTALQKFLGGWQGALHAARAAPQCKGVVRWAIDVDPLAI
jgi:primosomal protein N' (replication factor Y)